MTPKHKIKPKVGQPRNARGEKTRQPISKARAIYGSYAFSTRRKLLHDYQLNAVAGIVAQNIAPSNSLPDNVEQLARAGVSRLVKLAKSLRSNRHKTPRPRNLMTRELRKSITQVARKQGIDLPHTSAVHVSEALRGHKVLGSTTQNSTEDTGLIEFLQGPSYEQAVSGVLERVRAIEEARKAIVLEVTRGMGGTTVALLSAGTTVERIRELPIRSVACLEPEDFASLDEVVKLIKAVNTFRSPASNGNMESLLAPPLMVVLAPETEVGSAYKQAYLSSNEVDRIQRAGAVYVARPDGYGVVASPREKLHMLTGEWDRRLTENAKVGIVRIPKRAEAVSQVPTYEQLLEQEAELNLMYGSPPLQLSDQELKEYFSD